MNVSQATGDAAAAQLHATRALPSAPRPPKPHADDHDKSIAAQEASASRSDSLGKNVNLTL